MIDSPTRENLRDFRQRYEGSFGWLERDDGSKQLVIVSSVGDRGVKFKLSDKDDMGYTAFVDGGSRFHFTQVPRGWFNRPDGVAFFLTRNPQRQWSRGITPANTTKFVLASRLLNDHLTFADVEACFNPRYVFSDYENGVGALSRMFAMNKTHVYLYNRIIGTRKGRVLEVEEMFSQELQDTVSRNTFEFEVRRV